MNGQALSEWRGKVMDDYMGWEEHVSDLPDRGEVANVGFSTASRICETAISSKRMQVENESDPAKVQHQTSCFSDCRNR